MCETAGLGESDVLANINTCRPNNPEIHSRSPLRSVRPVYFRSSNSRSLTRVTILNLHPSVCEHAERLGSSSLTDTRPEFWTLWIDPAGSPESTEARKYLTEIRNIAESRQSACGMGIKHGLGFDEAQPLIAERLSPAHLQYTATVYIWNPARVRLARSPPLLEQSILRSHPKFSSLWV
jgi:hypothetical protein